MGHYGCENVKVVQQIPCKLFKLLLDLYLSDPHKSTVMIFSSALC